MLDYIVFFLSNIIDSLIIIMFLMGYLGSRFESKKKYLGLTLFVFLYVLLYFVLLLLDNVLTNVISEIIGIVFFVLISYLYSLFLLKGNPLQKIFPIIILILLYMLVNVSLAIIFGLIIGWFKISQNIIVVFITTIIDKVILFYVFSFVLNYIQRDENLIKKRDWIIIIISPIFSMIISILLIPLLFTVDGEVNMIIMFIVIVLLFASNIITYYLYVNTIKNNRSSLQFEQFKQQQEYERRHYNEMTKKYDEIRVLRHNIKNQLIYLESAIKDNKNDEAAKFINKLTQNVEYTSDYVRTSNYAVNCILNAMIAKATESNIHVNAQIAENIDIILDPSDVTIILGNLMENAIEACQKLKEDYRKIEIGIEHNITGLLIRIANKVENSVLKNNPDFMTDKQDKSFHGLVYKV